MLVNHGQRIVAGEIQQKPLVEDHKNSFSKGVPTGGWGGTAHNSPHNRKSLLKKEELDFLSQQRRLDNEQCKGGHADLEDSAV